MNKYNSIYNLDKLINKIYKILNFIEIEYSIIPETRILEKFELDKYFMD